ncbi:hypothetical protein L1889_06655 [Paenalcaligenes niemegkensis]|uniref:hypothetical protein n=1 Tax=Paenalcaligenes niemegkensis TaxID=2895469 RepID=UPI001EE79208|nr:hypothetical protein [Paenalcaligenes niemegkensis]MCQ9616426.1 hypothetical protein [Paenalcaligenes niemegkensis]
MKLGQHSRQRGFAYARLAGYDQCSAPLKNLFCLADAFIVHESWDELFDHVQFSFGPVVDPTVYDAFERMRVGQP